MDKSGNDLSKLFQLFSLRLFFPHFDFRFFEGHDQVFPDLLPIPGKLHSTLSTLFQLFPFCSPFPDLDFRFFEGHDQVSPDLLPIPGKLHWLTSSYEILL